MHARRDATREERSGSVMQRQKNRESQVACGGEAQERGPSHCLMKREMTHPPFLQLQKVKEIAWVLRVCVENAGVEVLWNVQMRGSFVSAETKGVRNWDLGGGAYLHNPNELVQVGATYVINIYPLAMISQYVLKIKRNREGMEISG